MKAKILKLFFTGILFIAIGCKDGYIDDITKVEPGEDTADPAIVLNNPKGDVIIPFTNEETDLDIQFEVTDDTEIGSVILSVDENEVAVYNDFKDYRHVVESYLQENFGLGEHTIRIKATDLSGKEAVKTLNFEVSNKYVALYENEIFYMPFEGNLYMELLSETGAAVVGSPGFAGGKAGQAYSGAVDSYLAYPAGELTGTSGFSAVFWYKPDADPDRAGILVISPEDPDNPDAQNVRTSGFRFLREGSATEQRFKLSVGTGAGETWNNGDVIDPSIGEWIHLAFTISDSKTAVYINGELAAEADTDPIDWTGCDIMSIMSGAPRFSGWGHLSDQSLMDELRLFNTALTREQIQAIIDAEI